jgi:hypothetical protein
MQRWEAEIKTYIHTLWIPSRENFFRTLLYFLPLIRSDSNHPFFYIPYKFLSQK